MTTQEYLFTCLMEEAAEIILITSKIKRFGLHEIYGGPENPELRSNLERLYSEVTDMAGVVDLMSELKMLTFDENRRGMKTPEELIAAKREKLKKYMDYSRQLGIIKD